MRTKHSDAAHKIAREAVAKMFTPHVNVAVGLDVTSCPTCGIIYALPTELSEHRSDGEDIYCPNGHTCNWVTSLDARIEDVLDRLGVDDSGSADSKEIRRLKTALTREKHNREQLEAELSSAKGTAGADDGTKGGVPC